jgi:hypothetical protein
MTHVHRGYEWVVGWNRPGHVPEETVRRYSDLATALGEWLNVIEADVRSDTWLTRDQREYWTSWLTAQRADMAKRSVFENRVANLEGDCVYVGRSMIWIILAPVGEH